MRRSERSRYTSIRPFYVDTDDTRLGASKECIWNV